MNDRARFQRIEALFHAAQALAPDEREALLARECVADAQLREEVESLLVADRRLTTGVWNGLRGSADTTPGLLAAGTIVGPYRVEELIGEGGMGEVYRATQLQPLKREVALKVVKAGMDTRHVLGRFENERQALAMMNHPGIARVLEAGATPTGRLYFAMELVEGEPITRFCDRRRLPLRARLELFARVCEAVQHAHQKGIIHRDLKPSNILVEEVDGRPRPKIIDFGIAKAVTPDAAEPRATTRAGQPVGTPEYMSPEQANPVAAVDTRTDVYSLGLLLYELLAGEHPFAREKLGQMTPQEVYRLLRDTEPERPSLRAGRSDEAARARGSNAESLRKALAGDLDWIVAKALEHEPERRYPSASGLAADIGRHLRNEAVMAGSPSRAYRARKFVRRHRLPVATAAVIVLVMLGAIAGVTNALIRARHAEADALHQAAVANEVTEFLTGVFAAEDPYRRDREDQTVQDIVRQAAERLESGRMEDPELYGRLSASLASVMLNQGLREEALALTTDAIARLSGATTRYGATYLELLYEKSRAESTLGRYEDARRTAAELVERAPDVLPPGSPRLGVYLKQRGDAEHTPGGTHEEQVYWHREAVGALREAPDASPENLAAVLHALASSTTDTAECVELATEGLELWRRHLGPDHPRVAEAHWTLGRCARLVGDAEEAQRQLHAAYDLQTRRLGANHPETFGSTFLLADALYELGRFDEAKRITERTLAAARDAGQKPTVATLLNQSFTYLPATADFETYGERLQESVNLFVEVYDGESEWSLMARHTRADGFANSGRLREARALYLEVLRKRAELGLPRNFFQALLLENLATVERRIGLFDDALRHIDGAIELYPSTSWDPRYHARAWLSKATLLYARGQVEAADAAAARASHIYSDLEGPRTFLDLRYELAWRATRGEREHAREIVRTLYGMGVHRDFLANEPELVALFGEPTVRGLATGVARAQAPSGL